MGDDIRRFSHESLQDAKTIKTLLTALAKGFAKGEMTLGDEDHELVLKTDGLMNVGIKAEREDGRCDFTLKVTWSDPSESLPRKVKPYVES